MKMAYIRKRNTNLYTISIYLGRDDCGKRKYYNENFHGTKTDAKFYANDLERKLKKEKGPIRSNMALNEFFDFWLDNRKADIREATHYINSYHASILKEYLGDLLMDQLEPRIIIERMNSLKGAENINYETKKRIIISLRAALNKAEEWKMLEYSKDLKKSITFPAKKDSSSVLNKKSFYNELEHAKLAKATYFYKHGLSVHLISEAGLRVGECFGLRVSNIDFINNKIHIRKAVSMRTRKTNQPLKTDASERIIEISDELVERLQEHCRDKNDDELVFTSDNGRVMRYSAFHNTFRRITKKAGLRSIRPHDLRHTAGAILLDRGYSMRYVADFLGHADEATTRNIYSHTNQELKYVSSAYQNKRNIYAD